MAFTHYKSVTIDHTQCGGTNSTDFPVSIWITDADFKTVANGGKVQNASGFDIRPYPNTVPSSALTFELVAGTYVATTGTFEMHVKLPTVNHSTNTVFYLFVGDAALTTDGSSTSTWDTHFVLVYHWANGTTASFVDSSQHGHNGFGTATALAAVLDGGIAFNGAPGSGMALSDLLAFSSACTISQWFKLNATGAVQQFFSRDENDRYFQWRMNASDQLEFIPFVSGSPSFATGSTTLSTGVTYHAAAMSDGANAFVFLNGVQDATAVTGDMNIASTDQVEFGARNNGSVLDAVFMDEMRYSDVARSSDWLLTEYNNQKPGSTFLTWGALTPVGGGSTPTTRLPLLGVG